MEKFTLTITGSKGTVLTFDATVKKWSATSKDGKSLGRRKNIASLIEAVNNPVAAPTKPPKSE